MIPELGHIALWLALGVSAVLGVVPMAGAQKGRADWMALARPLAIAEFVFVAFAFGCLITSFVQHDFSVLNVASNSNSALPLPYRIAASWGSHEGSLLLWVMMLLRSANTYWRTPSLPQRASMNSKAACPRL